MWGLQDLKQTRAYQEAQAEKQDEILQITVPLLLEKGMTVEEIAQHYKLLSQMSVKCLCLSMSPPSCA